MIPAIRVKELIKELEKCDPDSYVGAYNPVLGETYYVSEIVPYTDPVFVGIIMEGSPVYIR